MKPFEFSKYVLYVLLLICVVVGGFFFFGGKVALDDGTSVPVYTNLLLYLIMFFIGGTLFLTLSALFYFLAKRFLVSPKKAVQSVVGFIVLGILLFICWFLGNGTVLTLEGYNGLYNTASWLRVTDMFLNALYILIISAVLLIIGFYVARKIR